MERKVGIKVMSVSYNKIAIVTGAGGFIGSHLVKRLKREGYWVRGIDLKYPEFSKTESDDFIICDLREQKKIKEKRVFVLPFESEISEIYALAADMGGAGFCFTGENDADIMSNNVLININTIQNCIINNISKIFYSSSACIYPAYNQKDPDNPKCSEGSVYPADPDSEYGWEKLFSERLYLSYHRNYNLNVKIARFHNIFGIEGTWDGGREKAPAALCRKIAGIEDLGTIEIWGDGKNTRSFLYIDECLEGVRKLMDSDLTEPLNIGSEEMVTINQLVDYIAGIANKEIFIDHIKGPLGVRGRNSDNRLIEEKLGWKPTSKLKDGLELTYKWIEEQVKK